VIAIHLTIILTVLSEASVIRFINFRY